MDTHLVDTNFFIQAHYMEYPVGSESVFWQNVKRLAEQGTLISLDKVQLDLHKHDQKIKNWCKKNLPSEFFKNSTNLIKNYKKITEWAIAQRECYLPGAVQEFLSAGEVDAWLVAYSIEHCCTITTYDRSQLERKNKIKLPEVCDAFGIPYLNTAQMFYQLGVVL